MKRIFVFAFAVFCALALLGACSGGGGGGGDNPGTSGDAESAVATPQGDPYDPGITPKDFGGYEFRILANDHASLTWAMTTMVVEEETGEPILDSIYLRNKFIEDKYNIAIREIKGNFGTVYATARKSIVSGSDDFDLMIEDNRHLAALMQEGKLQDLTGYPHLDFGRPWWDKDSVDDLSIGKKRFIVAGDMTLAHYDCTCAVIFNKRLIQDNGLADPYALVRENKWTLDNFELLMKSVSQDLDGDGKFTKEDLYGFTSLSFVSVPAFLYGADARPVAMDGDGFPELAAGSEKFAAIYERLTEMFHADNHTYDTIIKRTDHRLPEYMFKEGKALFWSQLIYWTSQLRDMADDFGILPFPKQNAEQGRYHSMVFGAPVICIPATNADGDRTGMVMEAMCAESRRNIIPAYYDKTMVNKISRDDDTVEMLDIIFGSRLYQIESIYLPFVIDGIVAQYEKGNTGIAAFIESISGKAEKERQAIIEAFETNG